MLLDSHSASASQSGAAIAAGVNIRSEHVVRNIFRMFSLEVLDKAVDDVCYEWY